MKTLYLDCGMGAAGDMLTAALLELLPDPDHFIDTFNALSIPDIQFAKQESVKCGITGTHISVKVHGEEELVSDHDHHHEHEHEHEHHHDHKHDQQHEHEHLHEHHHDHDHDQQHEHEHELDHHNHDHHHDHDHPHDHEHSHHHTSMHDVEHIVANLKLPETVRQDILAVYGLIAEAESHAHGVPVTEIHFHEVGTMDAIADVTAVCMLIHELAPDEIIASPIHVGSGHVVCAHGTLPVPAPATAYILRDVPIYGGSIQGELCTPTGAALLKHFVTRFGDMPIMKVASIGYGMGKKDFPIANCVRAMLGNTLDSSGHPETAADQIMLELSCNVDDMTAEDISYAMEQLFEHGANEVYTVPIGMKKSRPGTLLRVICKEADRDTMIHLLFRHTTTIGIRETLTRRYVLDRKIETVQTPYGEIRRKVSSGYGVERKKYEFDDLSQIANEQGISLNELRRNLNEQ